MKTMTHYLMSFALMLALSACDTTKPVEEVTPEVQKSVGTFRGLLNGKPWVAQAEYFVTSEGYSNLYAVVKDPARFPREEVLLMYSEVACFCRGYVFPSLSAVGSSGRGMLVSENQGDGVVQMWNPVRGAAGGLIVQDADSVSKRFVATFEATFVATMPFSVGIQTLPDTLRITEGVFEITLNTGKK